MARSDRENGKLVAALAIGAAIVGMNFMRSRKNLRPVSNELADMAKEGVENVRRDWSERVREATGGAEDLKGKPFWVAAGLVVASSLISACVDNAKKQSERRADERKGRKPDSGERMAEYRARFKQWRSDPNLFAGTTIRGATTNCQLYQARDSASGYSLTLRAYSPEPNFHYYGGSRELFFTGDVEAVASDGGKERIFRLSAIRSVSGPVRFSDEQSQHVADLIATLLNGCTQNRAGEIQAFVLTD